MRQTWQILATIGFILLLQIRANAAARETVDLSGNGWKIWHDGAAPWKDDQLFLPPVDITKIPTNPPTGGWQMLDTGRDAAVPGTAEEYLQKVPGTGR